MSDLSPRGQNPIVERVDEQVIPPMSRRTLLAGAVATTAVATVGATAPGRAAGQDSAASKEVLDFIALSAILTGIDAKRLAPGSDIKNSVPGSDPINIKAEYFAFVKEQRPVAFGRLLKGFRDAPDKAAFAQSLLDPQQRDQEIRFLARSIILMWYLGAWYDPDDLKQVAASAIREKGSVPFNVISPKAYTQAWVWRVARAHPMGYSEWTFGYWQIDPPPPSSFVKA
jgi:hypothetical protein